MKYTIYDSATGRIKNTGDVPKEYFNLQTKTGESIVEGQWDEKTHYWDGTAMVAFPPRPFGHDWNWTTKTWQPNLEAAKAAKWEQMKAARNKEECGGFVWDLSTFDSNPISQSRIQGSSQMADIKKRNAEPFAVDWTLADNSVRTLNADQMIAVGMAMGQHITGVHEKARQRRATITNATSVAEVEAVIW